MASLPHRNVVYPSFTEALVQRFATWHDLDCYSRPSGRTGTNPVVSDSYLAKIQLGGRPAIFNADRRDNPRKVDGEPARHNTYQWDFVMEDGDFFKGGYGGQGLIYFAHPATWSWRSSAPLMRTGNGHEMTRIARQLAKSGLFDQ